MNKTPIKPSLSGNFKKILFEVHEADPGSHRKITFEDLADLFARDLAIWLLREFSQNGEPQKWVNNFHEAETTETETTFEFEITTPYAQAAVDHANELQQRYGLRINAYEIDG